MKKLELNGKYSIYIPFVFFLFFGFVFYFFYYDSFFMIVCFFLSGFFNAKIKYKDYIYEKETIVEH